MKKLSIYLFLILFSFSIPSFADDIRDFEIEGISLWKSATDYFNIKEIEERKKKGFVYKEKDFYSATFYNKDFFEFYDNVQLHLKKDDDKFIIYSVGGQKELNNNQNKCFKEMDKVLSSLKTIFSDIKVIDDGINDWTAPNNEGTKVKSYYIQLRSKDEISIQCYDHPENFEDYKDVLLVAMDSAEFVNWLYK